MSGEQVSSYDTMIVGYLLHSFYIRHSYSFELDWEREKVVARKLEPTFGLLQEEVSTFLAQLSTLANETD